MIEIKKENIVLTTGVVYAMYTAVEQMVKPDEKVMVMTPVYPPFFNTPKDVNREVVYCPLILEPEVRINLEKMEEMLKNDEKIKMLIFCNPHNPVGKSWTKEELRELPLVCKIIYRVLLQSIIWLGRISIWQFGHIE